MVDRDKEPTCTINVLLAKNKELEAEVERLRGEVSGQNEWRETVAAHNKDAIEAWESMVARLTAERDGYKGALLEIKKHLGLPSNKRDDGVLERIVTEAIGDEEDRTDDPLPWCSQCGAIRKSSCKCGPIADNE